MLFFFGIKGKTVRTELIEDNLCTHCQQRDTTYANVISRYVHLFWIPFFPVGKKVVSVCGHCKQMLTPKEMLEDYRTAVKEQKSLAKIPVWHFSGLILLAVLSLSLLLVVTV